jgi:hypothetical protein
MPLYWLCYQHNNQIAVVIELGASPIHARMRAALADLDQGDFTEGGVACTSNLVPKSATSDGDKAKGPALSVVSRIAGGEKRRWIRR